MANKGELTLDEHPSDPTMATVVQRARITPDDVRSTMHDAGHRLATVTEAEHEKPSAGAAVPRSDRRAIDRS
jgi:hypothetical protein